MSARLEELEVGTDERATETGWEDFFDHTVMYRLDQDRVLATGRPSSS